MNCISSLKNDTSTQQGFCYTRSPYTHKISVGLQFVGGWGLWDEVGWGRVGVKVRLKGGVLEC